MKRIIFPLVIVIMLVMIAVLAANLPPATVAQPDPLYLECLPDESFTTTVGNVTNFEGGASGGDPPYDWLWTVNGDPVASLNNTFSTYTNYTHAFNELGLYTVCVKVTDSVGNWTQCCKNATVVGPSLIIAKIDDTDPVNAGGTLNYTITVTNNGTASATNVTIIDNYDETVLNITDTDGGVDDSDTITWNGGITISSGGGFLSYNISANVSPTALGGYIFNTANVTCAEGVSSFTSINTTVMGALNLTCNITPNPTKIGHVTNFTANATGGVGNYTWSWTVNGTWVSDNQNTTYNFTALNHTAGIYNVCVNVTDLAENKAGPCCMNVTVNKALSLECNISPNTTRVDQAINCTAGASGGVGNYTWLWTVNGTKISEDQNTIYNFTAGNHTAGIYDVCVNVTDSLGNKEQCCTNVTVTGALNLTCDVSPNPTKIGHVTNFTAGASGGVPSYSWSWTVNGTKVSEDQNTTYNFTALNHTVGIYNVCINVTDSWGNWTKCCTNVTVNPPLILECNVSPTTIKVGNEIDCMAGASGGVGNYTWLWVVNGTKISEEQNTTYNFTAVNHTAGLYEVCVNVTDSLGNEEQCCTNITVTGDLSLVCNVTPNPTKIGHVTNFTANATGGVGNYTWSWTVNGTWVSDNQNTTYNFTAVNHTAGIYNVCVNVTDLAENKAGPCCTNVTVNPPLTLECNISPTTIKIGNEIDCMAGASGGVGNYTWLWTVNGTEVSDNQNTTYNFTAVNHTAGLYEVCVNVTDSLGNEEQCCTNITVNPALSLVLSPKTDVNLVGTFHVITATVYDQFNNVTEGVNLTWSISGVGNFSGTPGDITNGEGQAYTEITSSTAGTSTVRCEVTGNPSVYDTATKTWIIPERPSGGGGGCPPIKYLTVDWDGKNTTKRLRSNDELALELLGPSPDGRHSLLLEQDTHAPVVDGETYYLIVVRELEDIPTLPENTEAIMAFDVTPTGAVFNKDIFLTLGFYQSQLPEDASEETITIAYYGDVSGVWVPLESTQGERDGMLILSAAIDHLNIFAVLIEVAPSPPSPAHFVASGLSIELSVETGIFVTKTGESITVTANVANDGGQEGTYTVELKLDGETVDTETVLLSAGLSHEVSFAVSGLDYGQHEVEVDGLSDEFTTSRTITWWLIIVIIVAIGLIIWGVLWFRRRRKARKAA